MAMKSIRLLALCLSVVMWTVTSGVLAQSPAQNQKQTPSPQTTVAPTTDQQDDVVRISTNLVQVDAVVTKDGKQVRDLKACLLYTSDAADERSSVDLGGR